MCQNPLKTEDRQQLGAQRLVMELLMGEVSVSDILLDYNVNADIVYQAGRFRS